MNQPPFFAHRRRQLLLGGCAVLAGAAARPGTARAADTLRITGTGSGTGGMALLAQAFMLKNPGSSVEVLPALGSAGGLAALIDGRIDLAVSNRRPSAKETERSAGVLSELLYARTPFVIAVHRDLGIKTLTFPELAGLYREGGAHFANGRRARPVLRLLDATDTDLLKSMHPALVAAVDAAMARRGMLDAATDSEAANIIERTPGAFGPSTLALIESEKRPLQALALDGVMPTLANLANGSYRWSKQLYAITGPRHSSLLSSFLSHLQSTAGRRLLAGAGHGQP